MVNKKLWLLFPASFGYSQRVSPIRFFSRSRIISWFVIAMCAANASAQLIDDNRKDTIRLTVTLNGDGSRTVCQFDNEHHKATATTSEADGSLRGKIEYETDDSGRFISGLIFGPGEKFQFKALYKYDAAGRVNEETHLTKDEVLVNRIVYKYSASGKPAGYSVFDGSGKLVSGMATPTPATSPKSRNALGR
jgi:hypothetical protein